MKLKYNRKIIFESDSLEEIERFKDSFLREKVLETFTFLKKVNTLNLEKNTISKRNPLESESDYKERITKEYPIFYEKLEEIGKEYFKETFEITTFNIPIGLFGYKTKEHQKEQNLTEIANNIRRNLPKDEDFEIEQ